MGWHYECLTIVTQKLSKERKSRSGLRNGHTLVIYRRKQARTRNKNILGVCELSNQNLLLYLDSNRFGYDEFDQFYIDFVKRQFYFS